MSIPELYQDFTAELHSVAATLAPWEFLQAANFDMAEAMQAS